MLLKESEVIFEDIGEKSVLKPWHPSKLRFYSSGISNNGDSVLNLQLEWEISKIFSALLAEFSENSFTAWSLLLKASKDKRGDKSEND